MASRRYIPITRKNLLSQLNADHLAKEPMATQNHHKYSRLLSHISHLIHLRYLRINEVMKELYAAHDPESPDVNLQEGKKEGVSYHDLLQESQKSSYMSNMSTQATGNKNNNEPFINLLSHVADKANFDELSEDAIREGVKMQDKVGILVVPPKFEKFDVLRIWTRSRGKGHGVSDWQQRRKKIAKREKRYPILQKLKRFSYGLRGNEDEKEVMRQREVEMFKTVLIATRMRGEKHLQLKVFKDIPTNQLEIVLPKVKVKMGWRDRILIMGISGVGGCSVALKAMAVSLITPGVPIYPFTIGAGILFCIGFQLWQAYTRRMVQYSDTLVDSLYHKCLDSDFGALQFLNDQCESQECKEAWLAFHHSKFDLSDSSDAGVSFDSTDSPKLISPEEMTHRCNAWLQNHFNAHEVDFDTYDAIDKLEMLRLVSDRDGTGAFSVKPIGDARSIVAESLLHEIYHPSVEVEKDAVSSNSSSDIKAM